MQAYQTNTKHVALSEKTPVVDPHLVHMWEGRRSLTKRWKRQRLNRKLRARIEQLTEQANEYARQLQANNWIQFCDSLRGTLSTTKTWAILRSMLDPYNTKTVTTRALRTLVGEFKGDDASLIQTLADRYIGTGGDNIDKREYKGMDNPKLDAPITKQEVYAAALALKRNSAQVRTASRMLC